MSTTDISRRRCALPGSCQPGGDGAPLAKWVESPFHAGVAGPMDRPALSRLDSVLFRVDSHHRRETMALPGRRAGVAARRGLTIVASTPEEAPVPGRYVNSVPVLFRALRALPGSRPSSATMK
jgi:hypothetical protein